MANIGSYNKFVFRAPVFILLLTASLSRAAGPQFSTYLGGMWGEFATAVATDSAGNVYAAGLTASHDFPVTPGAYQTTHSGDNDAFVAKFSPGGALLWCTFYGGSSFETANAIGVDPAGNVIIAGTTSSTDLPVVNAAQPSLDDGQLKYYRDAFVAKFSADGAHLLYATYLGGEGSDLGWALAVDAAGNAYVAGDTESSIFPGPNGTVAPPGGFSNTFVVKLSPAGSIVYTSFLGSLTIRGIAVDHDSNVYLTGAGQSISQTSHAIVSKLSADGSREVYRAAFGGSLFDIGTAVAVDSAARAWVTGMTGSADFPLVRPAQNLFGARSLWKSSDTTATWNPIDNAPFGQISAMFADSGTLYVAAFDGGLFFTTDGGATWTAANQGLTGGAISTLVRDGSGALYVGTANGVYKSADGAKTWSAASAGLPANAPVQRLAADPTRPGTLYAAASGSVYKTADGGASWSVMATLTDACGNCTGALAVDPNTGNVFAGEVPPILFPGFFGPPPPPPSKPTLYRSTDAGASWTGAQNIFDSIGNFVIDASKQPSIVYAGPGLRSDDGGVTWTKIAGPQGVAIPGNLTLDPSTGALYAAVQYPSVGIYVSYDHAATWQPAPGTPFTGTQGTVPPIGLLATDAAARGIFWAVAQGSHSAAFVAELSADGGTLLFSTFLGGHQLFDPVQSNGGGFIQNNLYVSGGTTYAQGISLDPAGNVVVTGATRSKDFPTVNAWQSASGNFLDVFVTVFSPDGGSLLYSTYLGGGFSDGARAVAVEPQGAILIVGQTYSDDFPVVNAAQPLKAAFDDTFIMKLSWQ